MTPLLDVISLIVDLLNKYKVKNPETIYRNATIQQFSPHTKIKSSPRIVQVTFELMARLTKNLRILLAMIDYIKNTSNIICHIMQYMLH